MNTEDGLIPFDSTDLCGNRVLVLAPHPDDETIGCGGGMALHAQAGDPVKVIFLTNGAKGDTSGKKERGPYVELRKKEAIEACECLGVTDLEFWSYEDRSLAGSRGAIRRMVELLENFQPELVYVTSPLEFHPDHRATSFLLCDAIRSCNMDFQVAFYEVGQPLSVNVLVDITRVMDLKKQALYVYKSQLEERDYADVIIGLNRFRSLTLPKGVSHAEGFSLWQTDIVRKVGPFGMPFLKIDRLSADLEEAGPLVSIIVRTKDRPALLANALRSIAQQTYANLEIIVVNDGGQDVKDIVTAITGDIPVIYINHKKNKGRGAAANSGLKAARGFYLNLLDDDDAFLPNHVETLVSCLRARGGEVAYANALNVYFSGPPDSAQSRQKEELIFNLDYNPDILLFQNYIPTMSVLFSRDVLLESGGFCEDLELFEDWDFWIRVSRHFPFHHLDKVTAEYRFYGVTNVEKSHRKKYQYDEALVKIFDKNISFLNGKAWVEFLNEGSMGRFRGEAQQRGVKLAALEEKLSGYRERTLILEEGIKNYEKTIQEKTQEMIALKGQYDALLARNSDLSQRHAECRMLLEGVQKHPGYRVYKTIKGLMGKAFAK